ncbi:2-amino-4-hydroxy-6-hydroxymethyldihydropteridine pyrophosphokinase [Desulfitobacterium dichloroeliminans LMG P-21439]|uniref:2-amino-4-hydroxy-6-hydroxymethyldihydropteridine diphosphokinase n=1 Tax=Desulfitobacterium dichloroeliminans (strain LMG P-21439 / DCA1) TaxID=871963 RepID=L0F402_DESDL|nr:2-amino-4-hydroxy-6-hydroxymethyldihydropteridine diphosphokinase [Desulfitobacterium dichloroeliminans]AGA67658.1 2-amino-4-hydroxy-6-hydroxymethyldihydropteridine pyrophosphokinase [Desulfitobacterium dichloroeliminans LMG P-21439]
MKAYLSLGSNLGDRGDYLEKSCLKLMAHPDIQVLKKSSIYETKPWGKTDQSDFWNQVLEIETSLTPLALLDYCQEVENSLGRERLIHWGPRTIDIDLLNYDNKLWDDHRLILPHPRMEQREFVLAPLREIAPELVLPSGRRVTEVRGDGDVWRLGAADNS